MFLQRYYLACLSHASYMVADDRTRLAAVVDPRRDIDIYLKEAEEHGFLIRHVILTHFHADFVAGHIELRDKVGARISIGARAEAEFDFSPLTDGSGIELGDVRLEAMETPGHTPEGISLLVYDDQKDPDRPHAVLTGDTLFLGDVGRPDLLASIGVTAEELAEMLYHSLHHKLLKLPGTTLVYPAHGSGSMCGKALSDEAVSTLDKQRRYNYALQPMPKEAFVKMMVADQPEAPAYFAHDAMMNRINRPVLEETIETSMKGLDLDPILDLRSSGAQLVDVRPANDFAAGHLNGAVNIGIDGRYATWAGSLLDKERPIVIIAQMEHVGGAIMRLGRIGFHNVVGYLKEGMRALQDRPDCLVRTQRMTAAELMESEENISIIDVRTLNEWEGGHIAGSLNMPLNQLSKRIAEVPKSGRLVVHCQGGYRSMIAVSLLERKGWSNIIDLIGGYEAWTASKGHAS
ncbi:MAG: rhodanese-like domain-containing protein [Nitrospiria bacterium]